MDIARRRSTALSFLGIQCALQLISRCHCADLDDAVAQVQSGFRLRQPMVDYQTGQKKGMYGVLPESKQSKPIMWLHLHKAAGNFMCKQAKKQGEKTGPYHCCISERDRCGAKRPDRVHCAERRAASGAYSFTMVEREVTREDLECPDVLYGTMLRDPVQMMTITLAHNNYLKGHIFAALGNQSLPPPGEHGCLPHDDTFQHFDNFAVRTFSGNYDAAPGKLTVADLEAAKQTLRRMDVVLIFEEVKSHMAQLQSRFGWDRSLLSARPSDFDKGNQLEIRDLVPPRGFTQAEKFFLAYHNKLDYELYEYGKKLASRLTNSAHRL